MSDSCLMSHDDSCLTHVEETWRRRCSVAAMRSDDQRRGTRGPLKKSPSGRRSTPAPSARVSDGQGKGVDREVDREADRDKGARGSGPPGGGGASTHRGPLGPDPRIAAEIAEGIRAERAAVIARAGGGVSATRARAVSAPRSGPSGGGAERWPGGQCPALEAARTLEAAAGVRSEITRTTGPPPRLAGLLPAGCRLGAQRQWRQALRGPAARLGDREREFGSGVRVGSPSRESESGV